MHSNFYNRYNPYYDFNGLTYRSNNQSTDEIITLNQAIELMKKSVGDEKKDELFYNNLINQAPSEKEKSIIESIRNDERKHNQILRQLYYDFTGQTLTENNLPNQLNINNHFDYKAGLESALFGELDAVAKYRKIMATMPSGNSYALLMSIMTDELRHASKYNFLICNNHFK